MIITQVLLQRLKVNHTQLLASMQDRASVNAALETIKSLFQNNVPMPYICHTLNSTGEQFCADMVSQLISCFVLLTSQSYSAQLEWSNLTDRMAGSHSAARWWSLLFLVENTLTFTFRQFEQLIDEHSPVGNTSTAARARKLIETNKFEFMHEIAMYVEVGKVLMKANTFSEGDDFILPFAKEVDIALTTLERAAEGYGLGAAAEQIIYQAEMTGAVLLVDKLEQKPKLVFGKALPVPETVSVQLQSR